jgi:SAM-dependent methyltransferase
MAEGEGYPSFQLVTMVLSRRFKNDGMPSSKLDSVKTRARESFLKDIAAGRVVFKKNHCLCGETSGNAFEISEKDFHGLPLKVHLCKKCTLIYCDPYLDLESTLVFYRDYYRDLYEGELVKSISVRFDMQYKEGKDSFHFLDKTIHMDKVKEVLEVGCATGGFLQFFREASCNVSGIDLDERYLDFGRGRGLRLITSSFEDFVRGAEGKYDLIVMNHVLEHMDDPLEALGGVKDIIREDGFFFAEVPNIDLSYIELSQFQLAHKWYFDRVNFADLLERSGFEVVAVDTEPHLRIVARVKADFVSPPSIISRADYAVRKYRVGKWFERMLPLLTLIRAFRLGAPVKYIYNKVINKVMRR